MSKTEDERASQLHEKLLIIDSFGQAPVHYSPGMLSELDRLIEDKKSPFEVHDRLLDFSSEELVRNKKYLAEYKEKVRKAGVTAVCTNVGLSSGPVPFAYRDAAREISRWTFLFDSLPDFLVKAVRAETIVMAKKEHKYAIIMNIHNSQHFGYDVDNIDFFHHLGVRQVELTYNFRNLVGDGCLEKSDAGLSIFGEKVVERLNKLGMIIDVCHASHLTLSQTLQLSKRPIINSHTACYGVAKHDRNTTDEEIHAIAEHGGLVGISIEPFYISATGKATLSDFLDHIDHVANLVGVDHVCLGLISYGSADTPKRYWDVWKGVMPITGFRKEHNIKFGDTTKGYERYTDYPNITRGLVSRGYSDGEVAKIMGLNYLRLFEKTAG